MKVRNQEREYGKNIFGRDSAGSVYLGGVCSRRYCHRGILMPRGQPSPPINSKLRKVLRERRAMTHEERLVSTGGFDTLPVEYGRGFHRMKERLGPERAEALRQEVLQDQLAAREKYGGQPVLPRDRDSYQEYPKSKRKKSKRRKK